MGSKRKKLRMIGQRGVYVCLGIMAFATLLSMTIRPTINVRHITRSTQQSYDIDHHQLLLSNGRIQYGLIRRVMVVEDAGPNYILPLPPIWKFAYSGESITDVLSWIPWRRRTGMGMPAGMGMIRSQWSIFLLYPILGLCGWLFGVSYLRKRKRLRLMGCCKQCEYSLEGLDGGVCPECGDGVDSA